MFVMIAVTSFHDSPDLISISTHINPHTPMSKYDSNSTSQTYWFDHAGICCSLSELEPLNAFETIEGLLNTEVDNLILPAYFWKQSDVPSPWNVYWTEAAVYEGGSELGDPVFGNS